MKVRIYVKDYCPFCSHIETFLKGRNIDFDKVEVTDKPKVYEDLKEETGHQTVPQVFVNDEFIGGAQEFMLYAKTNGL